MTLQRWMFGVLAFSVVMCATQMWLVRNDRKERARNHREAVTAGLTNCNTCFNAIPKDLDFLAMYYGQIQPRRAWHARMAKKYELAAARPWLPAEPDPPPPDPQGQGFYWYEKREYSLAVAAFEAAVRSDSADFAALNGLAWLLATCPEVKLRDGSRAVELATRACALTFRKEVECVDTLAAARAEAGDFSAAIDLEREAIGMLGQADPILEEYRGRLEGYHVGKAYRDGLSYTASSGGFP